MKYYLMNNGSQQSEPFELTTSSEMDSRPSLTFGMKLCQTGFLPCRYPK